MRRFLAFIAALILALPAHAQSPQAAADALLAADRAFAASAASAADPAAALAPMFDAEVWMAVSGRPHLGREAVLAALRTSPTYPSGAMRWAPIRVGVSADGMQGFTFGYLSLAGGDPARRERKYLAYWVRRADGWRVVAYRQAPRAAGEDKETIGLTFKSLRHSCSSGAERPLRYGLQGVSPQRIGSHDCAR